MKDGDILRFRQAFPVFLQRLVGGFLLRFFQGCPCPLAEHLPLENALNSKYLGMIRSLGRYPAVTWDLLETRLEIFLQEEE